MENEEIMTCSDVKLEQRIIAFVESLNVIF